MALIRCMVVLGLALVAGCSSSGRGHFPDGEEDAGGDPGAGDPGADEGASSDAEGGDAGGDDALDADRGPDDAGDTDAGDVDPDRCPGPEEYIGDDWAGVLEISPDECCLAASIEGRALEDMYRTQAVMRIATGSYAVPIEVGTYSMRLPTCIQRFEPTPVFTLGDAGTVTVQRYGDYVELSLWQDVYDHLGQAWRLRVYMAGDGTDVHVNAAYLPGIDEFNSYYMGANTFSYYERWRHHVVFEGGELTSEFFAAWGSTPSSGLLVRAYGTLDGVAFDQADYWKLVNNHEHHFFGADWAVVFDAPIGGACGLRIDDGNPIGSMVMYDLAVHTVDCDLRFLEERAESDHDAVEFVLEASPCPGFL